MKHFLSILFVVCICMCALAQTPYDSFAPETSRPILDMEALSEMHTLSHQSPDTMLCALAIDTSHEQMYLVNISDGEIIAYAPITDDIRKWMSVDPLADKYPNISPYAYCCWNPINAIDPDGRDSIYVYDQNQRPNDRGVQGETYTATIVVVQNGQVVGEYRGSTYPNSKSNEDNSTPWNTILEGDYPFNNLYGHKGGTEKGLNIVDESGARIVPGIDPQGNETTITGVNVHAGKSASFFSHFSWTNDSRTRGDSAGRIFIYRL